MMQKKSQTCKTTNLLGHLGHKNEIPIEQKAKWDDFITHIQILELA